MRIFAAEGKLAGFLNRLGDLIALNILTLITMIPVVTTGAAITSMYEITLKMVRNEEGKIFASYFSAFRSNLQKSTMIWMAGAGITAFLCLDIWLLGRVDGDWIMYYKILLFVLALIVMMFTVFALVTADPVLCDPFPEIDPDVCGHADPDRSSLYINEILVRGNPFRGVRPGIPYQYLFPGFVQWF